MSFNYQKELSSLDRQAKLDNTGRLRLFRVFMLSFLLFSCLIWILPKERIPEPKRALQPEVASEGGGNSPGNPALRSLTDRFGGAIFGSHATVKRRPSAISPRNNAWARQLVTDVRRREQFLKATIIGYPLGAIYGAISEGIAREFLSQENLSTDRRDLLFSEFSSWPFITSRFLVAFSLRLIFLLFSALPFWLAIWFYSKWRLKQSHAEDTTFDILSVCNPKKTPFYSGIWGPLLPNLSRSGTDFSCPNLAVPPMAPLEQAEKSPLFRLLKRHSALSPVTSDLARIILAHAKFPAFVEDETPFEDDAKNHEELTASSSSEQTSGIISNIPSPLEEIALRHLTAVLEAHSALRSKTFTGKFNDVAFIEALNSLNGKLSPAAWSLIRTLTVKKAQALATHPQDQLATAVLALDAGKCLCFEEVKGGFVPISRYPHLQSRAIAQSLTSYHQHLNGDARQVIRQALITSRRQGDFGRAFLIKNTPTITSAVRDWLEVLSAAPVEVEIAQAELVELNSRLDALVDNWQKNLQQRFVSLRSDTTSNNTVTTTWKGFLHRGVVLMPLKAVADLALKDFPLEELNRIKELVSVTRALRTSIPVSARLPGLKFLANQIEHDKAIANCSSGRLESFADGRTLVGNWFILRRALARHNWLSAKVGDDLVPDDGLVQAIVKQPATIGGSAGFDAMVPIRRRRFNELFGSMWEESFYPENHSESFKGKSFTDYSKFENSLQSLLRKEAAESRSMN